MTVTKSVLLFLNGKVSLWLTDVERNEDGSIKKGWVVNGCWDFVRKNGEVLAKDSRYIVNRWPDPGYEEIPRDPSWKGDYNDVMNAAQRWYDKRST